MRKRFEQQLVLGQLAIEDTPINPKSRHAMTDLLAALKAIYCNKTYNERVFVLLENHISSNKKKTGRKGMDLWIIFVLSQLRLCLNASYETVHDLANNHRSLRQLMGVEYDFGYPRIEFEYQNIYDNVSLLSDELLSELNGVIVDFGHKQVFKKKEATALRLKTDSFVVQSNVHFPTDYNLLWDSARKCLDTVGVFLKKYGLLKGWRNHKHWYCRLKGLMRTLGKAIASGGANKARRVEDAAKHYLKKAGLLVNKLNAAMESFPKEDLQDFSLLVKLDHFKGLVEKHIDLVKRRLLKGEKIPHHQKMFSIFETYTCWVNKGKLYPNVELGRKLCITTDQFNLIIDYQLMGDEQDRTIVQELVSALLEKFLIVSWSFDKGFWTKENKDFLKIRIPKVIMPKVGRRNKAEELEETSRSFKRLKNKHCAIESNINELEHRGLDRCPDRGWPNYKRYISLGICAYNLKKIGRELLTQESAHQKEAAKKTNQRAA